MTSASIRCAVYCRKSSREGLEQSVLLSFAQFEREVTGERIRDKIAASRRKGMWMGGVVPLGYDLLDRTLHVNHAETASVREIYAAYLRLGCVSKLQRYLAEQGILSKARLSGSGRASGGAGFSRGALYELLRNRIYLGQITHKGTPFPGQHPAILKVELWDRVQAQLLANLQARRHRARSTEAGLLTGILFDSSGNRFTATHASRGNRRYRYYARESVTTEDRSLSTKAVRLPAAEVEEVVTSRVAHLLGSPQTLLDALSSGYDFAEVQSALSMIGAVPNLSTMASAVIRGAVHAVIVNPDRLTIKVNPKQLWAVLAGSHNPSPSPRENDHLLLETPCSLTRCRGCFERFCRFRHLLRGGRIRFSSKRLQELTIMPAYSRVAKSPISEHSHREQDSMSATSAGSCRSRSSRLS